MTEPFYSSERCFRQYEELIRQAVEIAPARFTIPPRGDRSQITVAARLRDAFRWLKCNIDKVVPQANMLGQTINIEKFRSLMFQYQICKDEYNPDNVVVAWRTNKASAQDTYTPIITYTGNDADDIKAFVLLRSRQLIGPVLFTALLPDQISALQEGEQSGAYGLNLSDKGILIV